MSDGGSEDTNVRSESEIKFGFISQFSNECLSSIRKINVVSKQQ